MSAILFLYGLGALGTFVWLLWLLVDSWSLGIVGPFDGVVWTVIATVGAVLWPITWWRARP